MTEKIGKYKVNRLIGKGGMAEVYQVEGEGQSGFKRQLCLKKIRREFADNPDFIRAFEIEARIIADMHHPNIVQVFEFEKHQDEHYLVMEYVEGLDLKTILQEASDSMMQLSFDFAVYVMEGLLGALHHAHNHKVDGKSVPVIHRDISPHNILISSEGVVKLADFGIAKAKGMSEKTRTGVIKGKFCYLSPEQARGGGAPIGPSSDLFSTGLVLWESITSERLFKATMVHKVVDKVLAFTEASLPFMSDRFNQFLSGLLAKNPADRFTSAEAALNALKKVGIQPCRQMDAARLVRTMMQRMERTPLVEQSPSSPLLDSMPGATVVDPIPTRQSTERYETASISTNIESSYQPISHERKSNVAVPVIAVAAILVALVATVLLVKDQIFSKEGPTATQPVVPISQPSGETQEEKTPKDAPAITIPVQTAPKSKSDISDAVAIIPPPSQVQQQNTEENSPKINSTQIEKPDSKLKEGTPKTQRKSAATQDTSENNNDLESPKDYLLGFSE